MKSVKKALVCIMGILLTGCGFAGTTYQEYVQAVLDCTYHDNYENYCALTNVSQTEAQALYTEEVSALSQRIQIYYGLKSDMITEQMKTNYDELAEEILKKTNCSVREVTHKKDGYEVTVSVIPVNFWEEAEADVRTYYEKDFSERYANIPTKKAADKMEEVYAFQVLRILTEHVNDMPYASPVSYTFTIHNHDVSAQTWEELDTIILQLK